jgi:hypothetical protein
LISNLVYGQEKVSIDKNVLTYEIKDKYERFDNVEKAQDDFKSLQINFLKNSDLDIKNIYSGGFIGYDINFIIDSNLNIKNVSYHYWTDNIDLDNIITYKVKRANLILNQNPFVKVSGLRGIYELEVEHYLNNKIFKTEKFKGKMKSFNGIDKTSLEYKWAIEQNKPRNDVKNQFGVYLNPDIPPSLKSNTKELIDAIKNLKGNKPTKIRVNVVINKNGRMEKEPIRFSGKMNKDLENKITDLLLEMTEWYPACVNNEPVKSYIPLIIGTE